MRGYVHVYGQSCTLSPELQHTGGDDESADDTAAAVTTEANQNHDNDNSDDNDDQHDPRSIQITYIVPGKRRRTITLARWDPNALRCMRRRLGNDGEREEDGAWEEERERGSTSDSAHGHHGNTRDGENDTIRVGVT